MIKNLNSYSCIDCSVVKIGAFEGCYVTLPILLLISCIKIVVKDCSALTWKTLNDALSVVSKSSQVIKFIIRVRCKFTILARGRENAHDSFLCTKSIRLLENIIKCDFD
ncbi:hypothetical protein VNO77_42201 [Canavalia gladiata]|uniref:Uncharacterized protein n=1 Tax=Canavalia gladiata TaxID=3824 RepID=A0AAN9PSM2_CANGL